MPAQIRFQSTRFSHIGARSGYGQFIKLLDPLRFSASLNAAPDNDDDIAAWLTPFREAVRSGIRHGRMPWYKLSDLSAEANALEDCLADGIDVVHFLDGEHCGQFLPRLANNGRLPRLRTVATFHQPPAWARDLVNRQLLREFDAVVLVSPSQQSFFREHVPADKLHVILHGVDTTFFRPASTPSNQTKQISCITSGHWLRDWEAFKGVARLMSDVTFIVVADLRFDNLPNVVTYSGVSDDALADLYRSADILFMPLVESTANNGLLEGMASGLPVVATDLEALRAYLPEMEASLVEAGAVGKYAESIRRLQHDIDLRHEMGRQARSRAEQLDWRIVVHRYEEVYAKVLEYPSIVPAPIEFSVDRRSWAIPNFDSDTQDEMLAAPADVGGGADLELGFDATGRFTRVDPWGYALFEAGLVEEAAALFRGVVSATPGDHRGHAGLATIAENQWQWLTAAEYWRRCSAVAPDDVRGKAIAGRANCLIEIGDLAGATELCSSIADTFEGMSGLARIAELAGPQEQALRRHDECLAMFPDRIEAFLNYAWFLLGRAHFQEAEKTLNHTIAVWPESTGGRILWAWSATAVEDLEVADARWRAVLAQLPQFPEASILYARHLAATRDRRAADDHVVSLAGRPGAIADFLLAYHLARKDWRAAVGQCQLLLSLGYRGPQKALHLARALFRLRYWSAEALPSALSVLQRVLQQSPASVQVKIMLMQAYIQATMNADASVLLQSIPAEDRRTQVEILRAWSHHMERQDVVSATRWRSIFLDFELLSAGFDEASLLNPIARWNPSAEVN